MCQNTPTIHPKQIIKYLNFLIFLPVFFYLFNFIYFILKEILDVDKLNVNIIFLAFMKPVCKYSARALRYEQPTRGYRLNSISVTTDMFLIKFSRCFPFPFWTGFRSPGTGVQCVLRASSCRRNPELWVVNVCSACWWRHRFKAGAVQKGVNLNFQGYMKSESCWLLSTCCF